MLFWKRTTDLVVAVISLLIAAPVMMLIAIAIRLESDGPVFFRQVRAGRNGRLFRIFKFRSMVQNADINGPVTRIDDHRVTRLGRLLRLTSLDELPQLFNVLKGDMSLVGPRPLLLDSLRPEEKERLRMKPGITGPVAVGGRQSLDWDQRMALDLDYVRNWSLRRDLVILLRTIPVSLSRANVYDPDGEMKARS